MDGSSRPSAVALSRTNYGGRGARMMEQSLFPDVARSCYVKTDPQSADLVNFNSLPPLEQSVPPHSVATRQAEFGDARGRADDALKERGYSARGPVVRGGRRMPLWPQGYTGTLRT